MNLKLNTLEYVTLGCSSVTLFVVNPKYCIAFECAGCIAFLFDMFFGLIVL